MTSTGHDVDGVDTFDLGGVDLVGLCGSAAGLSARELAERLVAIERVRRALEAATVGVLDAAERSEVFRDDGHLTVTSWAMATVNWSRVEAGTRRRELALVRLCPEVAVELAGGRLGVGQVGELARARANPRAGDEIADSIDELIGWAENLGFDGFRRVVRRWEQLADVDGAHRSHEAAHEGRRASLTNFDDTFNLTAQFGVVQGSAMAKVLEAFTEAEFAADWEKVKAEHGDAATPSMLERTASQRRADALFAVFMAAVEDKGRPIRGPLVHLVCDERTFEEHLARIAGGQVPTDGTDAPDGHDVAMGVGLGLRRCETIDGVAVDPGDVVAAALIGHVRRVVLNRAGVVVNAGRRIRLFRGIRRELAWLAGTTCCYPGCGHRLGVQIDHMNDYARDGPTDLANADPLDGFHNRFKTTRDYRITRDDAGLLHTWRSDGTEIRPA